MRYYWVWLVAAAVTSSVAAEAPRPAPSHSRVPEPRSGHRMVFDQMRGVVVLFGGWSASEQYLGDTWTWDGRAWAKKPAAVPTPRAWYGLAYDEKNGKTVLFGGRVPGGATTAETWEWNGQEWRMVSDRGPAARDHTAMAFDSRRGKIVLYGGFDPKTNVDYADTWEWDGTWRKVAEGGPEQVAAHAMGYLAGLRKVFLFGGMKGDEVVSSTWTWDGASWAKWPTNAVEGRSHTTVIAGQESDSLIRFGGKNTPRVAFGDTWELSGHQWRRLSGSGPPPRIDHAAAYDSRRKRVVLFGGKLPSPDKTRFGDTWEWDGKVWTTPPPMPGLKVP